MNFLRIQLIFFFVVLASLSETSESSRSTDDSQKFVLREENLAPLAADLLQFGPILGSSQITFLKAKYPLLLAARRTNRPDILNKFKRYRDGWNITDKHYWASVGFTGATGFVLALLWFMSFGVLVVVHCCCRCEIRIKTESQLLQWIYFALLLLFTCAAAVGCILLSVGQDEFHDKVLDTLNFVVNQSDLTVHILRNVTGYLSLAQSINVDEIFLPFIDKREIDKLNVDLDKAADILKEKTGENSGKIRRIIYIVRCVLISVATVMLLIVVLSLLLSVRRLRCIIYMFIMSGWLLVVITFILFGVFLILNNAIADACIAMDEWVKSPRAETGLSSLLPCVDEIITNHTLYQSKEVILQVVNVVNTAIYAIANLNSPPASAPYFYNQSGPFMPPLCPPFDSELHDRQCQEPWEISFTNASMVRVKVFAWETGA